MRTAGIICECNPFHRGHAHLLAETRARLGPDTGILCLMSGNFVQRGEPAICDKWTRAARVVEGGGNLVLELPLTMAVNAAGYFAAGAVECLEALGGVDVLSFGSERGELEPLQRTAALLEAPDFDPALRRRLGEGVSFARARELALADLGGDGTILQTPNNALGVDYLRTLLRLHSSIRPVTIPRDESCPSASELRVQLLKEEPSEQVRYSLQYGEKAVLAVLRSLPESTFQAAPFGSEGLWSKVMKAARKETSIDGIILACKSKRYAYTRLRRMLLCLYLGLSAEDLARPVPYLRVLAFNDRGRMLLRQLAETSRLPLVSGQVPKDAASQAYFQLECRATDLGALLAEPGAVVPTGREQGTPPVYKKP